MGNHSHHHLSIGVNQEARGRNQLIQSYRYGVGPIHTINELTQITRYPDASLDTLRIRAGRKRTTHLRDASAPAQILKALCVKPEYEFVFHLNVRSPCPACSCASAIFLVKSRLY